MSRENLVQECQREFDNCNYTAVSMFIWLRDKRRVKFWFIVLPIIFGGVSTFELAAKSDILWIRIVAALCAAMAGLIPSLYAALKYDEDLERIKINAAEFGNLRDRFRQCAILSTSKSFKEFEADFQRLMERMEEARRESLTPPERYFKAAQKKIASGDYNYDVDEKSEATSIDGNGAGQA